MARLIEHSNCPNPAHHWGYSPIKTVYIRQSESGKTTWKPVGWICTGCGVFRSRSAWFPAGEIEPVCDPWQPSKEEQKKAKPGPLPESQIGGPNLMAGNAQGPFDKVEDSAHDDGDKPSRQRRGSGVRVTISSLADLLQLPRHQVVAGVKAGTIPVRKDQYRHWSVSPAWYREKRAARAG